MSRGKLARLFVILAMLFAGGPARRSGDVAVSAQQVTTIMPADLQPAPNRQLPTADRLAQLHKALGSAGDPHDVILEIGRIGDASSVPFLIEALAKFGTVPREGQYGAIDTRFHVLDALQAITNHDAGRNADDWRPWYETNKDKTRQQWIKEGFAEHGFPVFDPPDDVFVMALIRAADPKYQPRYLRSNALRVLKTVDTRALVRVAQISAESSDVGARRGAVSAVEANGAADAVDLLRLLAVDAEIDVAENAMRALNASLRATRAPIEPEALRQLSLGGAVLYVLNEHTVVLGRGSEVVGLDLATRKLIWSYPASDSVRTKAVRFGDRLYFVADDRVIHCISTDGKPQWAKPLTANPDLGTRGPRVVLADDHLFVPDDKSIYVVTLSGRITTFPMGEYVSRHVILGRDRVFGAIHNGPLLVLSATDAPKRVPTGLNIAALSTFGNAICVVSFGPPYVLQCLDQQTLKETWRAELPNELGAYNSLEQNAENVYVLAQGRALAFRVSSGKRLWATNEFTSGAFFRIAGTSLLTRNEHFILEWRDTSSGEVIGLWGKREKGFAHDVTLVGDDVLVEWAGDEAEGLRLLALPNVIKRRLSER
jgi:outer membrane protein assembly factor BamB